jgi:hypothetical protein
VAGAGSAATGAFDAGWDARRGLAWMCSPPLDGQTAFDPLRNARKSARSAGQLQRRKAERKKAFAESWKRYQAKQKAAASA